MKSLHFVFLMVVLNEFLGCVGGSCMQHECVICISNAECVFHVPLKEVSGSCVQKSLYGSTRSKLIIKNAEGCDRLKKMEERREANQRGGKIAKVYGKQADVRMDNVGRGAGGVGSDVEEMRITVKAAVNSLVSPTKVHMIGNSTRFSPEPIEHANEPSRVRVSSTTAPTLSPMDNYLMYKAKWMETRNSVQKMRRISNTGNGTKLVKELSHSLPSFNNTKAIANISISSSTSQTPPTPATPPSSSSTEAPPITPSTPPPSSSSTEALPVTPSTPPPSSSITEAPSSSTTETPSPSSTSEAPTFSTSTTEAPTSSSSTTEAPTSSSSTTEAPTSSSSSSTTEAPTSSSSSSTTEAPTSSSSSSTTDAPTSSSSSSTTEAPTSSTTEMESPPIAPPILPPSPSTPETPPNAPPTQAPSSKNPKSLPTLLTTSILPTISNLSTLVMGENETMAVQVDKDVNEESAVASKSNRIEITMHIKLSPRESKLQLEDHFDVGIDEITCDKEGFHEDEEDTADRSTCRTYELNVRREKKGELSERVKRWNDESPALEMRGRCVELLWKRRNCSKKL